jgi:hypothetical protein
MNPHGSFNAGYRKLGLTTHSGYERTENSHLIRFNQSGRRQAESIPCPIMIHVSYSFNIVIV